MSYQTRQYVSRIIDYIIVLYILYSKKLYSHKQILHLFENENYRREYKNKLNLDFFFFYKKELLNFTFEYDQKMFCMRNVFFPQVNLSPKNVPII